MGQILVNVDGVDYSWETLGTSGWFTQEEIDGSVPLPSEETLLSRELRIYELLNGDE